MEKSNTGNTNFVLLSIVAVVAIVGIIIMVSSSSQQAVSNTYRTTAENSNTALSDVAAADTAGQAIRVVEQDSPRSCTDTDGGIDYYVKGTVTLVGRNYSTVTKTDFCRNYNSSTLVENYCNGTRAERIEYVCPQGCENGKCKNNEPPLLLLSLGESTTLNYGGTYYTINFDNYEDPSLENYGNYVANIRVNGQPHNVRQYEYAVIDGLRLYAKDMFISNIIGNDADLYLVLPYDECNSYNNYCQGDLCGDGILMTNEQCDSSKDLPRQLPLSCGLLGFDSGTINCGTTCEMEYDCYNYTVVCGNNYREDYGEIDEQCDGDDLGYIDTMYIPLEYQVSKTVLFQGDYYELTFLGRNDDGNSIVIKINDQIEVILIRDYSTVSGVIVSFDTYDPDNITIRLSANPVTCDYLVNGYGDLGCTGQCQYDLNQCYAYNNSCTDSDGEDYYAEGDIYGVYNGEHFYNNDDCIDTTQLIEYICSSNAPSSVTYQCPAGCSDNACI